MHSVYKKTINLERDGELVSIQAEDTPLSPLSLICDLSPSEMASFSLSSGDFARINNNRIVTSCCFFELENVDSIELRLPHLAETDIDFRRQQILECLSAMMPSVGFSDLLLPGGIEYLSNPVAVFAEEILRKSKSLFNSRDIRTAVGHLCSLIGLGIGLTPSGDDFLCGFLSGLMMYDTSFSRDIFSVLSAEIIIMLERTNEISSAFLRCAINGSFSEALCNFSRYESSTDIYNAFSVIGHSSGADSLCGLSFAFDVLRPKPPME
ncbi:MAG: DUF2877 domain-containing protein [Oscillospiraceae bacterium]|nr:DUF2877 domain-containing protein [Oscillospiraceae bacterium]